MNTPKNLFERRKARVRTAIKAAANGKLRLSVFRSGKHIYAQIIDDSNGKTLASASSLEKELAKAMAGKNKKEQAYLVGETIANRALKLGIKKVVFDRGGYIYTGRVEQLAEGARAAGLEF